MLAVIKSSGVGRLQAVLRVASRCSRALLAVASVCVLPSGAAIAASSNWVKADFVQARLLSSVSGTGDLASVPLGLEITLDDDWKTYWRAPGDAGLPPQLSWAGSANLASAALLYPAPQRLTLLGLQTFGYKHHVVFPIDAVVSAKRQPLDLKLKLDLLVCAKLCVPRTFDLALKLPAGPASPDPEAQAIAKARAFVPSTQAVAGLTVSSVEAVSDKGMPALEIKAVAADGFETPDVIIETAPALSFGLPRVDLSADRHGATFVVPLGEKLPVGAALAARDVTLTLIDGERTFEHHAIVTQGAAATDAPVGPSLIAMIGIALLGGLILNLMPCVLPVLSLKFIGIVSQGGRATSAIRAGFLATAAGIVVSFLALAAGLIAAKAAGGTIGWGLQFQEPAFIAAMAVLVTLFACHLWGLFEVPLPRFIANVASRRLGPDESLAGHFVTGAFATLLATPCSAPFLGTAVGFALAGDAVQMFAIFLALGMGLALPYLVVAALPQLAARMPKPGRWMLRVKQAMGLPLLATALWLLSILDTQIGLASAGLVAALLAMIVGVLVIQARLPAERHAFALPAIAGLALAAVVLPHLIGGRGRTLGSTADDGINWRGFDRAEIKSLIAQGQTVFVDVTADWCLTCQANRRLVLSQGAIADRLNHGSVAMKADWTKPNADIAAYLAHYGRYGIPFNIVYGPGAPSGLVLPELLSTSDVTAALDKAGGVETRRSSLEPKPAL